MSALRQHHWLLLAVAAALLADLWLILLPFAHSTWLASDFAVFWTAGRMPAQAAYDTAKVTAAQLPLTGPVGPRPFVSPPVMLLLVQPFAALPFWPAFLTWSAVSAGLFLALCRRLAGVGGSALALAAPAALFAAISGQVTLGVSALLGFGTLLLGARPVAAGLLFAAAALVKPQAALMVPVALVAAGQHRALTAAAVAGVAAGFACLTVQGSAIWFAWAEAMPGFMHLIEAGGLTAKGISPVSLAHDLGLPEAATAANLLGILSGVACTWLVFRRTEDPALRLGALACGSLLATPYAMPYEAAALLPAAAVLLTRAEAGLVPRIGALLALLLFFQPLAVSAFAAALILAVSPSSSPAPSSWRAISVPSWPALPWRRARR